MILLDTNVLSELMRPIPDHGVVQWLDAKLDEDVWISAVTVSEIRYWPRLIEIEGAQAQLSKSRDLLGREATELMNIFGAIIRKTE